MVWILCVCFLLLHVTHVRFVHVAYKLFILLGCRALFHSVRISSLSVHLGSFQYFAVMNEAIDILVHVFW